MFDECAEIREIVLVCREEDIAKYYALAQEHTLAKVRRIVAGGEERQASVFNGVEACSPEAAYYAIHDGARPLVTPEVIGDCLGAAIRYGAAAAGVPVKDTIKVASPEGFIHATPPRESLYAIQTPQIFEASLYQKAMEEARRSGGRYTDDCQLVERSGHRVFISRGDYANIKLTTPEDLVVASALIGYYEGEDAL
jgi:2-C-methyl-D-erythritol 4-phosphate cytidylyltransferase